MMTGDGKITLRQTPEDGWIKADDGTVGSALSGASNMAAEATHGLFEVLFALDDTAAPLFTSDGTPTNRAAFSDDPDAAWVANCRIQLTRQLGRAIAVAGLGTGLTIPHALGSYDGTEKHQLTVGQLPAHSLDILGRPNSSFVESGSRIVACNGAGATSPLASSSVGNNEAHPNLGPRSYWNVFIKL